MRRGYGIRNLPTLWSRLILDVNWAWRKVGHTIASIRNVGPEKLGKLSVEIELRKRDDGNLERREVAVEPSDLAPGEQGKYTLKVLSDEWSGSRLVTLRSGAGLREVAFNSLPGAKRPPEKPPVTKVVADAPRQKSRPNGGEFINTPDNPVKVP